MDEKKYIRVCLPLKLEWNPWYYAAEELRVGQRVEVRFARKPYIGVVVDVGGEPDVPKVLPVDCADTGLEDVSPAELELWKFVASYYMCTLGEVYKAAYPLQRTRGEQTKLRQDERSKMSREKMRLSLESRLARLESRLISKEADLQRGHRENTRKKLEEERAKILREIAAAREALVNFDAPAPEKSFQKSLSFDDKPLLICGCARVPFYIDEVRRMLEAGSSALILEPDTDFGLGLRDAISRAFPGRILLYGANITPARKREVVDAVRCASEPVVVIGIRSSVFLPFRELGLVIVDEEQDPSHKQSEPAPLYNARDVAAVLSKIHGARLILGSACPSLESLYNCICGKYDILELREDSPASVEIIDIPAEKRKHGMLGNYSRRVIAEIGALPKDALVTVVRCYQTEEDAFSEAEQLFPGRDTQILTAPAARKSTSYSDLTVVLQADALFDRADFRADEKALQMLCSIRSHTSRLVVQCGAASHPVYRALASGRPADIDAALRELLAERKTYRLPPYTRLVDRKDKAGATAGREVLPRDRNLQAHKDELRLQYGAICTFDVDPL